MDEIGAIWNSVTPYAGVWIEISVMQAYNINKSASLPTRECGLKSGSCSRKFQLMKVTPYAGVWIEIQRHLPYSLERMSLPTRECGLKYYAGAITKIPPRVTPYAGVWIEMAKI